MRNIRMVCQRDTSDAEFADKLIYPGQSTSYIRLSIFSQCQQGPDQ